VRRWLVTILLFLLLVSGGAIVNVAVAWGCAALITCDRSAVVAKGRLQSRSPTWWAILCRRPGCRLVLGVPLGAELAVRATTDGPEIWDGPSECLPRWCKEPPSRSMLLHAPAIRCDAFGWPLGSLECQAVWGSRSETDSVWARLWGAPSDGRFDPRWPQIEGGIMLPPREGYRYYDEDFWLAPRALPLHPIWPGFLINALFYAAVLWLLIPGPFALRRFTRIRRGRCVKCGYDLRGQPPEPAAAGCPECGWGRDAAASRDVALM
jgi:hypothetical protein